MASRLLFQARPLTRTLGRRWKTTLGTDTKNIIAPRNGLFDPFFEQPKAIGQYPRKTAEDVAMLKTPPTRTRMLSRDFIDDCLYNPNYGYFSKQAVIFSPEMDFDFTELRDHLQFMDLLARMYKDIEGEIDEVDEVARQVWHTPTELFKVVTMPYAHFEWISLTPLLLALVRLCCCKVHGVRVQAEFVSTQGSYYLRDGCW